jgi:hypothetical protein
MIRRFALALHMEHIRKRSFKADRPGMQPWNMEPRFKGAATPDDGEDFKKFMKLNVEKREVAEGNEWLHILQDWAPSERK